MQVDPKNFQPKTKDCYRNRASVDVKKLYYVSSQCCLIITCAWIKSRFLSQMLYRYHYYMSCHTLTQLANDKLIFNFILIYEQNDMVIKLISTCANCWFDNNHLFFASQTSHTIKSHSMQTIYVWNGERWIWGVKKKQIFDFRFLSYF